MNWYSKIQYKCASSTWLAEFIKRNTNNYTQPLSDYITEIINQIQIYAFYSNVSNQMNEYKENELMADISILNEIFKSMHAGSSKEDKLHIIQIYSKYKGDNGMTKVLQDYISTFLQKYPLLIGKLPMDVLLQLNFYDQIKNTILPKILQTLKLTPNSKLMSDYSEIINTFPEEVSEAFEEMWSQYNATSIGKGIFLIPDYIKKTNPEKFNNIERSAWDEFLNEHPTETYRYLDVIPRSAQSLPQVATLMPLADDKFNTVEFSYSNAAEIEFYDRHITVTIEYDRIKYSPLPGMEKEIPNEQYLMNCMGRYLSDLDGRNVAKINVEYFLTHRDWLRLRIDMLDALGYMSMDNKQAIIDEAIDGMEWKVYDLKNQGITEGHLIYSATVQITMEFNAIVP